MLRNNAYIIDGGTTYNHEKFTEFTLVPEDGWKKHIFYAFLHKEAAVAE